MMLFIKFNYIYKIQPNWLLQVEQKLFHNNIFIINRLVTIFNSNEQRIYQNKLLQVYNIHYL